jgi:hypothetical protein
LQGQVEGGVMMGLGNALTENFIVEDGYVITDHLARYRIPESCCTPEITPSWSSIPPPRAAWRQGRRRNMQHPDHTGHHQRDLQRGRRKDRYAAGGSGKDCNGVELKRGTHE